MPTDTERLDWLTKQASELYGWVARQRTQIQGYALHQTRRLPNYNTPRQAIDAAMGEEQTDDE